MPIAYGLKNYGPKWPKTYFMQRILTLTFFLLFPLILRAQDPHFTQFYASPLTLNPAMTGAFSGKYRVGTILRDQWRGVLDEPLRTFALHGDFRFTPKRQSIHKDAVGVGILFLNDRVSTFNFNTTQIAFSTAYHKSLNTDNTQYLSAGIQAGLTQRNVNYNALDFSDEFDGQTGYVLGTGEDLPPNNFSYGDFNVGLNYSAEIGRESAVFAGLAVHHFHSPKVSFYESDSTGSRLFRKYSASVASDIFIREGLYVSPRILIASQGDHLETNLGANVKMKMGEYGGYAFHLGTWARPVRNSNGFGLDAAVLLAGFEINNVLLGLSYDINLRSATVFRQGQGAFEISVAYLGEYDNEEVICPKF
jgi:type IX secretion system PorP/SprF family membrane protein